jgi:hypothetical protein
MNPNTPTKRIVCVLEMDADGELTLEGDDLSLVLPAGFLVRNGMFDEARGHDVYREDSDMCSEIFSMLAAGHGYTLDNGKLRSAMRLTCEPGPGFTHDPADYQVEAWYTREGV